MTVWTFSICSLDFMNDGFTVAAGTQNGKVLIYDLRALGSGGAPAKSFEAHERSHVSCVTFQHLPPKSAKGKPKVSGKENAKPIKTPSDVQPSASATTGLICDSVSWGTRRRGAKRQRRCTTLAPVC